MGFGLGQIGGLGRLGRPVLTQDVGHSTVLARELIGDIWNGLAIEFRENSYAMRSSGAAEILLKGENGLAVDFPANEYAMRA